MGGGRLWLVGGLEVRGHLSTNSSKRQGSQLLPLGHVGPLGKVVVPILLNAVQDLTIQDQRRPARDRSFHSAMRGSWMLCLLHAANTSRGLGLLSGGLDTHIRSLQVCRMSRRCRLGDAV